MRPTILILLFLVAAILGEAQNSKSSECPTLSVTGPAGITEPGDLLHFTVSIEPDDPKHNLRFEWKVEAGAIVRGQGTKMLEVRPEKYYNRATIATVKVTGLKGGCPNTASESSETICDPYLVMDRDVSLWTQYFKLTWPEERKKLDSIIRDGLMRYPEHIIYLEKVFKEDLPQKNVDARVRQINIYLQKARRFPKGLTFVRTSRGSREETTAYLVPPDAPVLAPNYTAPCLQ